MKQCKPASKLFNQKLKSLHDFLRKNSKKSVKKSRSEIHDYWRSPSDGKNNPRHYADKKIRSEFLLDLMKKYVGVEDKILELGCNVGRNLNYLWSNGYKDLCSVEINRDAVELLREYYPMMGNEIDIKIGSIEEEIRKFKDEEFDVVFTMAVLEHLHTDSEFVFSEMVRITKKYLITIEDEKGESWRHFPRNYKKVFEKCGLTQIEEQNNVPSLSRTFVARVFKKERYM